MLKIKFANRIQLQCKPTQHAGANTFSENSRKDKI